MPPAPTYNYKTEQHRYRHYFQQLSRFYQKPVAQVSTALLLTLFTITFFAVFAIRPTIITITELIKTINNQKEVLNKLEAKSSALGVVQSEYSVVESKLPLLEAAIPQGYQAQELLTQIEATAYAANLPIISIRLQEFTYPLNLESSSIQELPITITLESTFSQLEQIMQNIANLPRFLRIDGVNFSKPTTIDQAQSETLKLTIDATAYYIP